MNPIAIAFTTALFTPIFVKPMWVIMYMGIKKLVNTHFGVYIRL